MAADHAPVPTPPHPDVAAPHAGAHAGGHVLPTWRTYRWVALILALITAGEVWVYYLPTFTATRLFVPTLLVLSALKFTIVVMFYMHLKYDAKIYRVLFLGPLTIAVIAIVSLLFLFGHLAIRVGH